MRNRVGSLIVFILVSVFSSSAFAQVFLPGDKSDARKKAADASKAKLTYDPHDLSGIWRPAGGGGRDPNAAAAPKDPIIGDAFKSGLMGGAPPPPLTAMGQERFKANRPSAAEAWQSRRVAPALGNDPLGNCDPLGYPRDLGAFQMVQTPGTTFQIFNEYRHVREIWTDGRTIPPDMDPRWYGWNVGRWEGNNFIVDSTGYDDRSWLDGNGWPHSEDMKLHEVYAHPDAMTLEITMTLDDPSMYTKTWVGVPRKFNLTLPKDHSILDEYLCVPSEEQSFNNGVRNPAGGDLAHSRPLK
jgi:hypothetical protein